MPTMLTGVITLSKTFVVGAVSHTMTVSVDAANVVATGYYWDGDPWVQLYPGTSAVVVRGWTPAVQGLGTSSMVNGAQKNVRGAEHHASPNTYARQGVDARNTVNYDPAVTFAPNGTLSVNDVLVIATSAPVVNVDRVRPDYHPVPSRSWTDWQMTLTCVDEAPTADDFRPNAIGDPAQRQKKKFSQIQWQLLPSMFLSAAEHGGNAGDHVKRVFANFCGDLLDGWTSDSMAPNFQHPGYGRWMGADVSDALLYVMSDAPLADRQLACKRLLQWGIDLWGAFRDGRSNDANGGHGQGRKPLIILAGHLFADAAMVDPGATVGAGKFWERWAYYSEGPANFWGGTRKSTYGNTVTPGYSGSSPSYNYQDKLPSDGTYWTQVSGGTLFKEDYVMKNANNMLGVMLAMGAIGRLREWSVDAWAYLFGQQTFSAASLAWDAEWPRLGGQPFWHVHRAIVTGDYSYSNRSGLAKGWARKMWLFFLLKAMGRDQTYVGLLDVDSAFPVTFDVPVYDVPFTVCVFNAPDSTDTPVVTPQVWAGHLLEVSRDDNGFTQWCDTDGPIMEPSVPNDYGYHTFDLTLDSDDFEEAKPEIRWCIQVVYRDAGGDALPVSFNPLVLTLPAL